MRERRGETGRVTILDIARATGVSKSSVSRFLDDRSPSNSETARLVRRVATELGYVRDASAANLRRGSTGTIGVIVPRLTDTVMAMLYESLARASRPRRSLHYRRHEQRRAGRKSARCRDAARARR
jgi:LacI family transcriptional regulator